MNITRQKLEECSAPTADGIVDTDVEPLGALTNTVTPASVPTLMLVVPLPPKADPAVVRLAAPEATSAVSFRRLLPICCSVIPAEVGSSAACSGGVMAAMAERFAVGASAAGLEVGDSDTGSGGVVAAMAEMFWLGGSVTLAVGLLGFVGCLIGACCRCRSLALTE